MRKQCTAKQRRMPQHEAKPYFLLVVLQQLYLISHTDMQTEELELRSGAM